MSPKDVNNCWRASLRVIMSDNFETRFLAARLWLTDTRMRPRTVHERWHVEFNPPLGIAREGAIAELKQHLETWARTKPI